MNKNRFELQIEMLNVELIKMGALCEEAIHYATKAFVENERSVISIVREKEKEIDEKEVEIEALCMRLLLTQQPVAKDLRFISTALHIISDMERIGDQALDIAKITTEPDNRLMRSKGNIEDMAEKTAIMVTKSIDAYAKNDLDLIMEVKKLDDVLDAQFIKIKENLIDMIKDGKYNGEFCLDMLMIAKYLERIGDHATNIVEWVEYSILGHRSQEEVI